MNVLMVGVGPKRVGGMWTVAEQYINSYEYNAKVNLTYIPTSTNGSIITRTIYMIIGYVRILNVLRKKDIEIVHIHMAEKGSTFRKGRIAKWAKKRNKKVIIHLHAGPFMAWFKSVTEAQQKKIKAIFECADLVLVLGEYWKKELSEILPQERMRVLYNGVDCPDENPYDSDAKNIVYFGVMRKEKGTYDLISAIKKINDQLPKETIVVLCGNDLEGDIWDTIKKEGLEERFLLPGWVTGEMKEEIYKNAMIDVLPSYFEGLSMTVLEAMARGIPVITTKISTMPEVLGENTILLQPGDVDGLSKEILHLTFETEQRKRRSQDEYKRIQDIFSTKNHIQSVLDMYSSLLRE